MTGTKRHATVQGTTYEVWSDFCTRKTYAKNPEGEIKAISAGGYITNDLTVRKAVAAAYGIESFRK